MVNIPSVAGSARLKQPSVMTARKGAGGCSAMGLVSLAGKRMPMVAARVRASGEERSPRPGRFRVVAYSMWWTEVSRRRYTSGPS
jgi:hypothetical protein